MNAKLRTLSLWSALVPLAAAQGAPFEVDRISDGTGTIYPYRIRQVDAFGNPTNVVIDIRSRQDLLANATPQNPVLPVSALLRTATLPNGAPGNQFVHVRFTADLELASVLSGLPANQANSFLTGAVAILVEDPRTGAAAMARGQAFVGGMTWFDDPATPWLDPKLVQAVARSGNSVVVLDPRANGFPRGFAGDVDLVAEHSLVLVADADGDLSTFETFPSSGTIRIVATNAIRQNGGGALSLEVCTATTVGVDTNAPRLRAVEPANGQQNVDLRAPVVLTFDKPMQPRDVGSFLTTPSPQPGGVAITATTLGKSFPIAAFAEPWSHADLCRYVVLPLGQFPGLTTVRVDVSTALHSLATMPLAAPASSVFVTTAGPGIVNAPVAPEAIYVGIGGAAPGVSVIDLNGFGQGTGLVGMTSFPRNPNIGQPGVHPALAIGTSTLDAGGEGALTFTRDHLGSTRVLAPPLSGAITDLHIGWPLDVLWNNDDINRNATSQNQVNAWTGRTMAGNSISSAPHPNPPKLVFPPPNPLRGIFGEEPTMTSSQGPPGRIVTQSPPCLLSAINLLGVGNPFNPTSPGIFGANFAGVFYGPQPPPSSPPPPPPFCPFTVRQQVGHFLYALDRDRRRVLVLNSNRFTILATIALPDPTGMALSPNLEWLAVTNHTSDSVSLIDVNPLSLTFHRVLGHIPVGRGPRGVAWQPEGEDLIVCNTRDSSLTIVGAGTGRVRHVASAFLRAPLDVAVTARQVGLGFNTGTYLAYVLNSDGTLAVYESGPHTIGFDGVLGTVPSAVFPLATAIQPEPTIDRSAVWITHQDTNGLGQLSLLELTSSPAGPQPNPYAHTEVGSSVIGNRGWTVTRRIGGANPTGARDPMSGNAPVDVAFDDLTNAGGLPDVVSTVVPNLRYARHSGKGLQKRSPNGAAQPANTPRFAFVALADTGKVDVFEVATGKRIRTLDAPGVRALAHYWRQ
jgi:DNA-binding beta-propeller fold protein YncE